MCDLVQLGACFACSVAQLRAMRCSAGSCSRSCFVGVASLVLVVVLGVLVELEQLFLGGYKSEFWLFERVLLRLSACFESEDFWRPAAHCV